MDWAFIWLMFVLKIPIVALLLIVWYAVRATVEPHGDGDGEQGGGGLGDRRHPRGPRPRPWRRGPHGDPPVPAPRRVRTAARKGARTLR